jgi:GAF domain-containing protein
LSRSEIVLPIRDKTGAVTGVLDVDHDIPGAFDLTDQKYLTEILTLTGDAA